MKKAIMILMVLMMFSGCSSQRYANLSSVIIGCNTENIQIDHEPFIAIGGTQNWQAVCMGKRYSCSYQSTTGVNCIEMINPL